MSAGTCWYGHFFSFWYMERVPRVCLHLSVTFYMCDILLHEASHGRCGCTCMYPCFRTHVQDGRFMPEHPVVVHRHMSNFIFTFIPCGLVVRVPGYRFQRSWVQFLRYQIFWGEVDLERGSLIHVTTIEELLGRNSGTGLANWEYGPWCSVLTMQCLLSSKVGTNFTDKRQFLSRHSSITG
jgi:hypothetical protein